MFVTYNGTTPVVTLPGGATVGTANPPGTLIPAGSYTVEISVSSEPADFQIVGPGLSFLDNEPSTEVYTITFAASSTYSFEDVNNPAGTLGYFSTTATFRRKLADLGTRDLEEQPEAQLRCGQLGGPAEVRPTPLEATVSAHGAVSLEAGAKRVSKLGAKRRKTSLSKAGAEARASCLRSGASGRSSSPARASPESSRSRSPSMWRPGSTSARRARKVSFTIR